MTVAALITWIITAFGGLYLLAIWLIEYDVSAPGGAVSRLPRTVITGHVLLATTGLVVWIVYLIVDRYMLALIALSTLFAVVLLGLTMLGRWIMVRRTLASALPWIIPPVIADVLVFVLAIIFIKFRPQGLISGKGV